MPFQSAPLTEARGDAGPGLLVGLIPGFNPLPSPKRGETSTCKQLVEVIPGFNPLPSPKRGETSGERLGASHEGVSIRSPHRSEGRPIPLVAEPWRLKFQSAPLTEARGDAIAVSDQKLLSAGFNPLPSPKRGETSS